MIDITEESVTVFGAYGHTGRFVVAELRKRGWSVVLSGRDAAKLAAAREQFVAQVRLANVGDSESLDAALTGSRAVINCAGPFLETAVPLVEAALRSRAHYLDIAAEQAATLDIFERYREDARTAGLVITPAMAFFGGLADLLATAAMDDWENADEISIAAALDSWRPTHSTRLTGQRNPGRRFFFSNHKLELADPPPGRRWRFPMPFGEQDVVPLSLTEAITISRHLQTRDIRAYMNLAPLVDLRNPDTPAPTAADEAGRSSQVFVMDVIARRARAERRAVASGRDIYAVTAPIVVEATERLVAGVPRKTGVVDAGEIFDARDFLKSLGRSSFDVAFEEKQESGSERSSSA